MASSTAAEESIDQSSLRRIDIRLRGLAAQSPNSSEVARMRAAREDVLSRISPAELAAYEKAANPTKTNAQIAAEAEAERIAMEANRDKPAI
ncbi:MAG TPA: hypothetical protein VF680_14925 [Allosphingosinicella sp.]|jgi:hypothetical protein